MSVKLQLGAIDVGIIDYHVFESTPAPFFCGEHPHVWDNFNHDVFSIGVTYTGAEAEAARAASAVDGEVGATISFKVFDDPGYSFVDADILYNYTDFGLADFDTGDFEDFIATLEAVDAQYEAQHIACPTNFPLEAIEGAYRITVSFNTAYLDAVDFGIGTTSDLISAGIGAPPEQYDVSHSYLPQAQFYLYNSEASPPLPLGYEVNPVDPDGDPPIIFGGEGGSPIADLLWITEGGLVGPVTNPSLPAGYKILNRSSDITGVINGFMTLMEDALPLFVDKEDFSEVQDSVDLNHNRILGLSAATAVNDLVRKDQV